MKLGTRTRINQLQKLAELQNMNNVMIVDLIDGKHYFNGSEIDLSKIRAKVVIVNDIPKPPHLKGDGNY